MCFLTSQNVFLILFKDVRFLSTDNYCYSLLLIVCCLSYLIKEWYILRKFSYKCWIIFYPFPVPVWPIFLLLCLPRIYILRVERNVVCTFNLYSPIILRLYMIHFIYVYFYIIKLKILYLLSVHPIVKRWWPVCM